MLANIIDRRKKPYIASKINAVIEPSYHDNHVRADLGPSDQHPAYSGDIPYCAERYALSLADAVAWANGYEQAATLFLYDEDFDPMELVK
jgi:hypothetical protein